MVLKVKKFLRETVFCHRKFPLNANKMQVYKDLSFVSIFIRQEPCPFGLGLRKFALDPVVVILF